ncbi:MAG TPA: hypothetical protein VMV56_04265 [Williamwhitmania sp.]|nr:hypothetical protein [Williamwhitmania sp.]
MNKLASKIISIALHPIAMPSFLMLALFNSGTLISFYPMSVKFRIFLLIFVYTLVLPLLMLPIFLRQRLVKSIHMFNHTERIIPFLFAFLFYAFSVYTLMGIKGLWVIKLFMLASTIAVFITLAISFFWKISAHMVGMGGATGFLLMLNLQQGADILEFIILALILSGVVGTARLSLDEHSPLQIYSGYLIGLTCMVGVFLIL